MLSVSITINGLDELAGRFQAINKEAVQQALLESVNQRIIAVAKAIAPKRTGALQASIRAEPADDGLSVNIIADKPYSKYLEFGTKPHLIEATNAKALHFAINGKDVFAKLVMNPGIPQDKFAFIRPAIEGALSDVIDQLIVFFREELS